MDGQLVPVSSHTQGQLVQYHRVHPLVETAGEEGRIVWEEFFSAQIANVHTRSAYRKAVVRFLDWADKHDLSLIKIEPGMVGKYFADHPCSIPTKKLELAGLRSFFDRLVNRHLVVINPCHSVRLERHQVIEGKTPEITGQQARQLLASIGTETLADLRDRAIIGVLIFTAARVGAVAKLQVKQFILEGRQYVLQFDEKNGKSREIPVHHELEQFLLEYIEAAGFTSHDRKTPLFRAILGRTHRCTVRPITVGDIGRMLKRRLHAIGLPARLSPHSFRVCTITDLLTQGVPLEDVQFLAGYVVNNITRLMLC